MPKVTITINQKTDKALRALSKDRGIPMALMLRDALEEYLVAQGRPVDTSVEWGGPRKTDDKPRSNPGD